MKTYRNEQFGFEINMPEEWRQVPSEEYDEFTRRIEQASAEKNKTCFQFGCIDEAFNFVLGPLFPERLLEYTELEFRLYAQNEGYMDLEFGRILVEGKEHVWASYYIDDGMGERWNKKYMIVLGEIEYSITGTCDDPSFFTQRHIDWDSIISSFRLIASRRQQIIKQQKQRREAGGNLYEAAYEAVSKGQYKEALTLLEKCLLESPNHTLAHKESAVVLRQLGDVKGAIDHRWEVKRLDPSDILNRTNLSVLLEVIGDNDRALQEIEELLEIYPNHQEFKTMRASLLKSPVTLTYPQHYEEECAQVPGDTCQLKLTNSHINQKKTGITISLTYKWDRSISYENAFRLNRRARAYISCGIYDVAISMGLFCQAAKIFSDRRPSWLIDSLQIPVSLTNANFNYMESVCLLEIGQTLYHVGLYQGSKTIWEKLLKGFENKFGIIEV